MKFRKPVIASLKEYLKEQNNINENINNIDHILDKVNKEGKFSLTYDERTYLKQYSNNNINTELEKWLFSEDDETFDLRGNKLLFDEFEPDEDILYNHDKLKRVISNSLDKSSFTNNSDWGGGHVWNINSDDNFIGTFLFLGDDELVVLKRTLVGDEYKDETLKDITNTRELYSCLLSLKNK